MGRNMFSEYQERLRKNTIEEAIKTDKKEFKKVTYSLPVTTLLKLQQASEKTRVKKSNIVTNAIEKYIENLVEGQ